MTVDRELELVQAIVASLSREERVRVGVVAQVLRDLLIADESHGEVMLAFTLVMAEVAAAQVSPL